MNNLDLDKLGIVRHKEIYRNLSYDELFRHETDPALTGYEKGTVTKLGAVAVDTGQFTGRSPKDKYIVDEPNSHEHVWWASGTPDGSDNKAISQSTWDHLKEISVNQLLTSVQLMEPIPPENGGRDTDYHSGALILRKSVNGRRLYVMDGFCGANPATRLLVRLVTEVAWMAHFFKNMFIRPTVEELNNFKPDWTILNACKAGCADFAKYGLRSEVFVAFHLKECMTVIGGTWYGGEIKKGIFSIMNYFLPLKGIGAFHCSANRGEQGDTALFFGLSGTGKTTLSTDPKRKLIGDDEHGWDEEGIFNFEGGCYAKCINLSAESEPDIFKAIRRDALLENVEVLPDGKVDFTSSKKTENTRVSYPIHHIDNIVKPTSKGGHPKKIIFLTCDAYGIFPPVALLNSAQAMYHYLSGYTAKVAGTELGVLEPKATFSACFGKAFLTVHPTQYADILGKKMEEHASRAYLVNTGWVGGKYGVGKRMALQETRKIIDAILDGTIDQAPYEVMPVFNLKIPKILPGVSIALNPRNSWTDQKDYDETLKKLAQMFIDNFKIFTDTPQGKTLVLAGPQIQNSSTVKFLQF